MQEKDPSQTQSDVSMRTPGISAWIRIGAIAGASALAGGLAAAWFYRKTLNTLREAESQSVNIESEIPDAGTEPDT
jgi:flagellar basal body-associated protein FliL